MILIDLQSIKADSSARQYNFFKLPVPAGRNRIEARFHRTVWVTP